MANNLIMSILFVLLVLAVVVPFGIFYIGERSGSRFKGTLGINIVTFFGILIFSTCFLFSGSVHAETVAAVSDNVKGMAYLAAALVTGLCTIGTGIATGSAASAALGALSENEKIMGKALIFVSLAEGIAIYGLLISFTILGRV